MNSCLRYGKDMSESRNAIFAAQAKIFKALGHPSRLIMLDALSAGEKCVCDLQALVGSDMSTVSKHLAVLREAGVVETHKEGTNVYYRLTLCCLDTFLKCSEDAIRKRLLTNLSKING